MHRLPFQPTTMPVPAYPTGLGNEPLFLPQQSHLTTPPSGQPHSELRGHVPQINFTPTSTRSKIDRLILNPQFGYYWHIIRTLLHFNDRDWDAYTHVRQTPSFREILPTFWIAPPPDIFNSISYIRDDKHWETSKAAILKRVDDARRLSAASSSTSNESTRAVSQNLLTPASASTRSRSRDSQFQRARGSRHPRTGHPSPTRAYGSSYEAASPTLTGSYGSIGNGGRTAPDGFLYYCPSKNCKRSYGGKGYLRQGHYENHMRECHAEWPVHDASSSLRQKPLEEDAFMINSPSQDGTRVSGESFGPTTPQPIVDASTPHTPFMSQEGERQRPTTPSPERVLSDTIETGTEPEISRPFNGFFHASPSVQRYQRTLGGSIQIPYYFPEGQQTHFPTPSEQTGSNSGGSYCYNDSYMRG